MTLPGSIAERAAHFSGRGWVFDEVDAWLQRDPGGRYFLITGEPGSGKTAIAARLFQFSAGEAAPNGYAKLRPQALAAAHFCSAADANSIDPRHFASSLALQLSARSPSYAQALKNVGDKVININVAATNSKIEQFTGVIIENLDVSRISAQDAFNRVVIDPLLDAREPFTILVDSLDEALRHSGDVNIVKLLSNVASLPAGVRFILTSRVDGRVESRFPSADGMYLSSGDHAARNHADIEEFAAARLAAAGVAANGLAKLIADKADGNFQYAQFVVKAVAAKQMDPAKLEGLPAGLDAIYHESLTRVVDLGAKSWAADYAPAMGVLSVAQERLTADELRSFSGQSESAVWDAINDLQQFVEPDGSDDPRYSLYHYSVTEFLQRRQVRLAAKAVNNGFYLPPAEWHRRMAARNVGPPSAWDLYGLRYAAAHLAHAAGASSGVERLAAVRALVALTTDAAFRSAHLARISSLPELQRNLEEAVRAAARDTTPEGIEPIVEGALSLVRFRREELRPEPVFDLAMRGEPEAAGARIALFEVDAEWRQIATGLAAWLAADADPVRAKALRDRVGSMPALSPRAARLLAFFDAWSGGQPEPPRHPLPPPLPEPVAQAIVERMGGSGAIAMAELLAAHSIPEARNPSLRANEGYLSQHDGPYLVSYAQATGGPGDDLLLQYIAIHTGYQYVEYRNRSLGFLLDAVFDHGDARWIRGMAAQIAASALAGSRSDYQEALPAAVTAERSKTNPAHAAELQRAISDAVGAAEELAAGRRSDPLSRSKRWLAVLVEATHWLGRPVERQALIEGALKILRTGFAGYSAPACLTIAEAIEISGDPYPGGLREALDAALSAAHNVQDPTFCARITSRVHAIRDGWWGGAFDVEAAVERFRRSPDAAEFCPAFHVGEQFEHRAPGSMEIEGRWRSVRRLEDFEAAFRLHPGELTPLNPTLERGRDLGDGVAVRLPDPGFATWLAARFAGRAMGLPAARRSAALRSLIPLAAANATALDTVLARLALAEAPSGAALERIAAMAAEAVVKPGAMAASLPDAAFPA